MTHVRKDDFATPPEKLPDTQPANSGGPPDPPPRPPKRTARDLLDSGDEGRRIFVPEQIEITALAALLEVKSFKVVADILELGQFKHSNELVDFETAAQIARKRGIIAEKLM